MGVGGGRGFWLHWRCINICMTFASEQTEANAALQSISHQPVNVGLSMIDEASTTLKGVGSLNLKVVAYSGDGEA